MSKRSTRVRPRLTTTAFRITTIFLCWAVPSLHGAEITLVPVGSDGPHVIVGNEITIPMGGQHVIFEIFISGWDPDGDGTPKLRSYQASIDEAGFTSGTQGSLTPALLPCVQDSECVPVFGGACFLTGIKCVTDADCLLPDFGDVCAGPRCAFFVDADAFCEPGYILSKRADFMFGGGPNLGGVDLTLLGFRFGAAAQVAAAEATDTGVAMYAGTLVLDVSVDAAGTFTVGFLATADTLLIDPGSNAITPIELMSALVTIPDCNGNGVADTIDLSSGASDDCNGNGIPDDCESDCNGNGIQDDCDIRDCLPENLPGCNDCNLNGVPDSCDISLMNSLDADLNGVPDECIAPVIAMGNWSNDIWGLDGSFPDNVDGTSDLSVTLQSGEIFLDTTVIIDNLRLEADATLSLTQVGDGDMLLQDGGNVSVSGTLRLGDDNVLDLSGGLLSVEAGGFVGPAVVAGRDASVSGLLSGSIFSGDVLITGGDCFSPPGGGELSLAGAMSLTTSGDLVISAPESLTCCGLGMAGARALGITPPPKFGSETGAIASVDGDFVLSGRAGSVFVAAFAQGQAAGVGTGGLSLGGDFINHSTFPTLFDWSNGRLELRGAVPQTIEVGGIDLGLTFDGFATDVDTLCETGFHTNYSVGTLEIAAGSDVTFTNAHANTVGVAACEEALYVRNLIARAGSTLTLDNVRLYVDNRIDEAGVTVNEIGCGDIVCLSVPLAPISTVATNRYLSISVQNTGRQQALQVTLADLPGPFSIFNGLVMWVGEATDVSELGGNDDATPPTFKAATLQCVPFFADWGALGTVSVSHESIIPKGHYEVRAVNAGCDLVETSSALSLQNSSWGDVVSPFTDGAWPPADGTVDVAFDVVSILDKFSSTPTAPPKAWVDLDPGIVDRKISIIDVTRTLDAFSGSPYPFVPGPMPCP